MAHEAADDVDVERFRALAHERDETGHVGPFLIGGQRNGHGNRRDRMLGAVATLDDNGKRDAAHTDSIDGDVATVMGGLHVRKIGFSVHGVFVEVRMTVREYAYPRRMTSK